MAGVALKPIAVDLDYLYIEPVSACNLRCRMCYTNVISGPDRRVLDAEPILDFARRFLDRSARPVVIYWCGTGEVFLHERFPQLVNVLTAEYGPEVVSHTVQTNGTIRRLGEFVTLANVGFRVSIDGPKEQHEWHRGKGTFDPTVRFCRDAVDRGCQFLDVRMLLTRDNIHLVAALHDELVTRVGPDITFNVMVPYTSPTLRAARDTVPAIVQHDIDDSRALPHAEARARLTELYGDRFAMEGECESVSNYLSLNTYGVTTCCNGVVRIGDAATPMDALVDNLTSPRAVEECYSCALFPCM